MDDNKACRQWGALAGVAAAGLLAGCASTGDLVGWNIPPAGSSWQVEQHNTGSYGKDTTFEVTRGASVWNGQDVITLANSATGATIMALPAGKWAAIVGRDGRTMATFEPPIGYLYPLSVGQKWSTKHKVSYANGTSTDMVYSCSVEAREKVTVPAGTFDTLRIACETPFSRDVSWSIVDLGMHAKQDFRRFEGHPQGAGTQLAQLVVVHKRK